MFVLVAVKQKESRFARIHWHEEVTLWMTRSRTVIRFLFPCDVNMSLLVTSLTGVYLDFAI